MHIHVLPGSPWWMSAAADATLAAHVGGGLTGLVSGAVAVIAPKGGRWHVLAGNAFVASMLVVAGVGAAAAPLLPQRLSVAGGAFTLYLVLSAWTTVRRRPARAGWIEVATMIGGVGALAVCGWLIWMGSRSPDGAVDGQDYSPVFVFAILITLALALDVRMLRRGGVSGAPRLARHLWRMCLALFVASGSFFLGQPQLFPEWLLRSNILFVPALAPLAVLAMWMVRLRVGGRWRMGATAVKPRPSSG